MNALPGHRPLGAPSIGSPAVAVDASVEVFGEAVARAQETFVDIVAVAASSLDLDDRPGERALRQIQLSQRFFGIQRDLVANDIDGARSREFAALLESFAGRDGRQSTDSVARRPSVEHAGARRTRRGDPCLRRLVELEDRWDVPQRPLTAPPTITVARTTATAAPVVAHSRSDDWSPLSAVVPITLAAAVVAAVMAWLG